MQCGLIIAEIVHLDKEEESEKTKAQRRI